MDTQELKDWDQLFSSNGWRRLLEQAAEEIELIKINSLAYSKDYAEVCLLRGQAMQLQALLDMEAIMVNQAKADEAANDDDEVYLDEGIDY